jgi:hypothetical protein
MSTSGAQLGSERTSHRRLRAASSKRLAGGSLPTLNALLTYLDEQKLSRRKMRVDELFVPNISPGLTDYLRATGEG